MSKPHSVKSKYQTSRGESYVKTAQIDIPPTFLGLAFPKEIVIHCEEQMKVLACVCLSEICIIQIMEM